MPITGCCCSWNKKGSCQLSFSDIEAHVELPDNEVSWVDEDIDSIVALSMKYQAL